MFETSQSKKELTIILIIIFIIVFIAMACIPIYIKTITNAFQTEINPEEKPKIIDHFACSDYCPGSKDRYMVKIYQGIDNESDCQKIGGYSHTYQGWQKKTVCLVKKTKTLSLGE